MLKVFKVRENGSFVIRLSVYKNEIVSKFKSLRALP
jgi:hypothetical protein